MGPDDLEQLISIPPARPGPRARRGLGALSPLDARVLSAVDPCYIRTAARVAARVGCAEDVAHSCLKRLRSQMLIVHDGCRPVGWLRTQLGDLFLEHQP